MSGPKRNPDKLNTIGVVVVGICGAVMVYVTIVALQAFYMNDTAEMQANKDFGGMDQTAKGHKADEMRNITEAASNAGGSTYRIPIEHAMELVVTDAAKDPSHLVPALPSATKPTIEPHFGRPQPIGGAAPAAPGAVPEGVAPATGAPAQQGSGTAPGSAAAPAPGAAGAAAPQTPTGQGPGAAGASPGSAAAQPTGAAQPKGPAAPVPAQPKGAGSAAQPKGAGAGSAAQPKGAGAGSAAQPKGAGAAAKPKGAGSAAHP